MHAESDNIQDYLKKSEVIDYDHKLIVNKCRELEKDMENIEGMEEKDEISLIRRIYEFVRDDIDHSGDIGAQEVTCKASEVLESGHGICCAKSHLLAAMLRYFGIPAGFCYQKLCSGQEGVNRKVLHGLNAVYLKDLNRWIRLDARGNKPGVDAQFSIEEEKIAWPVNKELGEEDNPVIFIEPNPTVVEVLKKSNNRKEMWAQWDLGLRDLFDNCE
jgi:transglutaminase-like putative cysteine protease